MINVLHITPALKKGGIEKLLRQWETASRKNDVRFSFAVYVEGGDTYDYFKSLGYKIYTIPQFKNCGYHIYKQKIKEIVDDCKADIVHINAGPITWIALKAVKSAGVKTRFIHAHTNLYPTDKRDMKSKIIHRVSIIFNSRYSTLKLACSNEAGKYCFGHNKFILLKNGINLEEFDFNEKNRADIRAQMGVDENKFVVGFVGRLTEQKNPFYALRIFKEVSALNSDAYLWIIGEGEYEQEMRIWCKQNHIEDRVCFCGITDKISEFYSGMDCLIVPSLYEGLSLTTVEALTSGLKVIASTHVPKEAGINENITFKSLDKDAKEWAEAVLKVSGLKRYGCISSAKKAGYDEKETAEELMSIYKKAVSKNDRDR